MFIVITNYHINPDRYITLQSYASSDYDDALSVAQKLTYAADVYLIDINDKGKCWLQWSNVDNATSSNWRDSIKRDKKTHCDELTDFIDWLEPIYESGVMDHTFERDEEAFYETIIEAFRWADGQLPGNNYGVAINGLYQRYIGDE